MTLHGPDPELFRTKVYGARWYCDPLPADDLAPATEERWPAVTTIKKAWSKPFRKSLPTGELVSLDAYWAAEFTVDHLDTVESLSDDRAAAVTLVATSPARRLNAAADRGTGVHAVMEDLMAGKEVTFVDPAVEPFVDGCRALVADWAPTSIATEVVAINRTIGFGGTADAIWSLQLEGKPWVALVDYKSRGGDHACYEEDAAQVGGYSLAEYIVVASPIDGRPMRMELPALDGGLVVSLTVDGYQLFPVDLRDAQEAFMAMRVGWESHRNGTKAARRARKNILLHVGSAVGGNGTTETSPERQTLSDPPAEAPSRENGDQPANGSEGGDVTPSESEPVAGPTPEPAPGPIAQMPAKAAARMTRMWEAAQAIQANQADPALLPARIEWVRDRVDAIKAADGGKAILARYWSEHDEVPTFPKGGPTTAAEVDVVAQICTDVERELRLPFPDDIDPAIVAFEAEAKAKGLV